MLAIFEVFLGHDPQLVWIVTVGSTLAHFDSRHNILVEICSTQDVDV